MIEFRNVSKKYGNTVAVNNLDLQIFSREVCVIVGPSGSGKSTILRMVNRLVEPSAGEIYLDGKNIMEFKAEHLRRGIGYVIQSTGLFPHLNVGENIAVVPQLLGWSSKRIKSKVYEMLEIIGLKPDIYIKRFPHELSGGEAQRIGVARALASDPPVLLMDEPFSAVDPVTRMKLQDEFFSLQKNIRKTVIFVTHDVDEAVHLADRIVVFKNGSLIQYDVPEEILEHPADNFVSNFIGADRALKKLSRYTVKNFMRIAEFINMDSMFYDALKNKKCSRFIWVTSSEGKLIGSIDTILNGETKNLNDILLSEVNDIAIMEDGSLKEALSRMIGCNARTIPVVDRDFRLKGEISLSDIERVSSINNE